MQGDEPEPMKFQIALTGADELRRNLATLEPRVAKKVIRRALRAGSKIILDRAKATSPVLTGALRNSLRVRAMTRMRKSVLGMKVVTGKGFFTGETFYGAFVEFGHKIGSRKLGDQRKDVPGKHFIQEAAETMTSRVGSQVSKDIAAGIEAEWKHG